MYWVNKAFNKKRYMKKYVTSTWLVLLLLFVNRTWSQQNLTMVKDINPGTASAFNAAGAANAFFWQYGNNIIFPATNGVNGYELWISDGTANGTNLLKDLNPGGTTSNLGVTNNMAYLGNNLLFYATGNLLGAGTYGHLGKTDGTSGGTMAYLNLNGLITGTGVSASFYPMGNTIMLVMSASSGSNTKLWKTDGTTAGTVAVKELNPSGSDGIQSITVINNRIFFSATDGTSGNELWVSDGTAAGTVMVKDINPGSGSGYYGNTRTVAGNLLFFTTDDGNGNELWRSDGTAAGTFMVKDINNKPSVGSTVYNLTTVGNQIYFLANDEVNGLELWKSDGTSAGTVMVKDLTPGSASSTFGTKMYDVNGVLYFAANDGVNGLELWKSDGTTAGTVMVKDINPGGSSGATDLYVLGNQSIFTADDGITGAELWVSDGTTAGTHLLKDLNPGLAGSTFSSYTNSNGWLFFLRTNGSIKELWKTNGTAEATVPVYTASAVNGYIICGSNIYASVTTSTYGRELFFGNVNAKLDQTITFGSLPANTYGDVAFALTATSSSGLPVTYTSSDPNLAKIINSNEVQLLGAGMVTITAHQSGNDAYNAASDASQQLVIGKAALTIKAEDKNSTQGNPFPLFEVLYNGFINSDDENDLLTPVSYTTTATVNSPPGTYDIIPGGATANNYTITFVNGTLTVTATPLLQQTITFNALPVKTAIDPDFNPSATASSGLPVMYTSNNTAVATIVNNQIHIVGTGTSIIRATQPGNSVYDIAPAVTQTLTVVRASQTIALNPLPRKTYGDASFDAGAVASSGLPVTYSSSNTSVAVIENGLVRIVGLGVTQITAAQAGNAQYDPASNVQPLTVGKTQLFITAENKTRYQGQNNPGFTVTVSGFVNNDDIHSLATPVKLSTTATISSAPGMYDIIVSGATSLNYDLVFVNGKLTVEPALVGKAEMDAWFNSTSSLLVNVLVNDNQRAVVRLMDVSGRLLVSQEITLAKGQNSYTIPAANLPAGPYILKIHGATIQLDKKLLKR